MGSFFLLWLLLNQTPRRAAAFSISHADTAPPTHHLIEWANMCFQFEIYRKYGII